MKQTNWSQATTDPAKAIAGLLAAIYANKNAWIELQDNGEQSFPVKIKNPALDNPFNWTMSFGVPNKIEDHHYFNDTEKDLTENWIACFGETDAIRLYQTKREIIKGISVGIGTCHPVRKEDLIKVYPRSGDANFWYTYWRAKKDVPYWIVDPNVKQVYVVCTDDQPAQSSKMLERLKLFVDSLTHYYAT